MYNSIAHALIYVRPVPAQLSWQQDVFSYGVNVIRGLYYAFNTIDNSAGTKQAVISNHAAQTHAQINVCIYIRLNIYNDMQAKI